VLAKLKLFAEGSHQLVDKWFVILSDNISRHAMSVDDMGSNKINKIFFFDFSQWDFFRPFGKIVSCRKDV